MSRKLLVIKLFSAALVLLLFFIVLNGFFRENKRLLEEMIFWQEKAASLEEEFAVVQREKIQLQDKLASHPQGLLIKDIKVESALFLPGEGNKLTYSLAVTVENSSSRNKKETYGICLFTLLTPEGRSVTGTSWRSFPLPAFGPGEKKTLAISGKLNARAKEELLILVNIWGEPGLDKIRLTLPEAPAPPETSVPEGQKSSGASSPSTQNHPSGANQFLPD